MKRKSFISISNNQRDLIVKRLNEEFDIIDKGGDISAEKRKWQRLTDELNGIGPNKKATDWKKVRWIYSKNLTQSQILPLY